jgi:hypothetical protein
LLETPRDRRCTIASLHTVVHLPAHISRASAVCKRGRCASQVAECDDPAAAMPHALLVSAVNQRLQSSRCCTGCLRWRERVLLTETHSCGRSAHWCSELVLVVVDTWLAGYVDRVSRESQKHREGDDCEAKKTPLSATAEEELKSQKGHFLRTFRVCLEGARVSACARQVSGGRNNCQKREASDALAPC